MSGRSGRLYVRVVPEAAEVGVATAVWTWAGELPNSRRRIARLSVTAMTLLSPGPNRSSSAPATAAPEPPSGAGPASAAVSLVAADAPVGGQASVTATRRVPDRPSFGTGSGADRQPSPGVRPQRVAVLMVAAVLSWVAVPAVSRRVQRRWLDRLERAGHPHPHRSLALTMGSAAFVLRLAGRLARPRLDPPE